MLPLDMTKCPTAAAATIRSAIAVASTATRVVFSCTLRFLIKDSQVLPLIFVPCSKSQNYCTVARNRVPEGVSAYNPGLGRSRQSLFRRWH